jgi:altronate hydrolase
MIKIHESDNIATLLESKNNIPPLHKIALRDIKKGEYVIKFGCQIGVAYSDINEGEHVHTHNLKSALTSGNKYKYTPHFPYNQVKKSGTFSGFPRDNGSVGIRNEIWVINAVGCTNKLSKRIVTEAGKRYTGMTDGIFAITHPYGCSQLGADHDNTRNILAGIAMNPNAGGVLILGLGCENNSIPELQITLGDYNERRIKFLVAQECENEIETALGLIDEIVCEMKHDKREPVGLDKLVIGFKCGGSDSLSGITANPLVGRISDLLCSYGGTAVLTETPEMFGAETILMNRCISENEFNKTVIMINKFKQYFLEHGQEIYENPSPGNKAGGITTLEEKSLGCVQKGGSGIVTDVLNYGERVQKNGLVLLDGPGNDIVAVSALTAAGCNMILFTTGCGTPLGGFSPTLKISSNSNLACTKKHWIDYDAGALLSGKSMNEAENELWDLIIDIAEGKTRTKSEINDYREFAIFKTGITL